MSLRDWVEIARKLGASDLHLEGGSPLVVRVDGELRPMGQAVSGNQIVQVGKDTLGADAWAQFLERGSADMSVVLAGTRCRINVYRTIRGLAIAVRLLVPSVHDFRTCNLHPDLRKLMDPASGLVVISGPTGCGKSTTLAALIEELNATRSRHIIIPWNICSPIAVRSSGSARFRRIRRASSRPSSMPCARTRMFW
jgi:twitching motility protein PilT